MTLIPRRAKDVFASVDSNGNKRTVNAEEVMQWGQIVEAIAYYGMVARATSDDLDAFTPASGQFPAGKVDADPVPGNNGYHIWTGSEWERTRGFPDAAAVCTNIAGTADAITADLETGVDPAIVQLFILPDPPGTNATTSPTLTLFPGEDYEVIYNIKAASGGNIAAGSISDGVGTVFFKISDTEIGQLVSSALPVLPASNAGAGTANAIVATTESAVLYSDGEQIISLPIAETNTSSTVTVSFNGGASLSIKTSSGVNDPAIGGLLGGVRVLGQVDNDGTVFRMISDQSSAAIQAAAEAAQAAAEAATTGKVDKTGDTMTGALVVNGSPFDGLSSTITSYSNGSANDLDELFVRGHFTVLETTTGKPGAMHSDGTGLVSVTVSDGEKYLTQTLYEGNSTSTTNTDPRVWVREGKLSGSTATWGDWRRAQNSILPTDFGASTTATAAANSTAFSALAAVVGNRVVDLEGKYWPVTSVPDLRAENGYWTLADYEASFPASVPAGNTLPVCRTTLTDDDGTYNAWTQDNMCIDPVTGTVYLGWNRANNHSAEYQQATVSKLENGVWTSMGYIAPDWDDEFWLSAMDIVDGVLLAARRKNSDNSYKLFAKRTPLRVELTDVIQSSGSNKFYINYADFPTAYGTPGLLEGNMYAEFDGVDVIGGQDVNNTLRACSFINATRIEFAADGTFSGPLSNTGGEFSIFFPESEWIEIQVAGDGAGGTDEQLSDAIDTWYTANVDGGGIGGVNLHSMTTVPNLAGTFYIGISGGNINIGVAKITRPFDGNSNAYVEWVREISADSAIAEPTVHRDPATGNLYGFGRTQTTNVPPIFWWSDDELLTATVTSAADADGMFYQSPIPLTIQDGIIYATASGSRTGDIDSNLGSYPEEVPMYLMQATIAEAEATGMQAFTDSKVVFDEVTYAGQFYGGATSIGVGSIAALGNGTILTSYGGEIHGPTEASIAGIASPAVIFATKIDVDKTQHKKGKSLITGDRIASANTNYWRYLGSGGDADGTYYKPQAEQLGNGVPILDITTGIVTIPSSGRWEFKNSAYYEDGTAGFGYLAVVDPDNSDATLTDEWAAPAHMPTTGTFGFGSSVIALDLLRGQRVAFKVVATQGIASSSVRSSVIISRIS